MLTKEENDLLTQTGPDTPGGNFMRRYWLPVGLADELTDEQPIVPARVLGEDLAIYRDQQGTLGLVGRFCSHRGTDLCAGWAEENGVRCPRHGWLYDEKGRCIEMPMEPPDSPLYELVRHTAYPIVEKAGLLFGYLGPGEPPLLPAYDFLSAPSEGMRVTKYFQECNYLQASEGNVDPMQLLLLQRILGRDAATALSSPSTNFHLGVDTQETDFGARLFATRTATNGGYTVEVRNFMLPSLCTVSALGIDGYTVHWHVPIDDLRHWRFVAAVRRDGPLNEDDAKRNGVERLPGYRFEREIGTRALLEKQDETNYVVYATALAESQGPIFDRTLEHLGDSDRGLVSMRTVMHRAIQDVQEGAEPLHVIRHQDANDLSHIVTTEETVADPDTFRARWIAPPA